MTFGTATLGAGRRVGVGELGAGALLWQISAIVVAAAALQIHGGMNTDTSWYITLAEKMLDGRRLYVDFVDINSPSSTLLCVPPVFAARLLGVAPELMVDLFCFAGAGLSLALAGVILTRGGLIARAGGGRLLVFGAAALLLLPGRAFAQREHIALIASLPCVAALAVWAARGRVEPVLSILAGVGVGAALSIKPHFALFFAPPLVYLARRAGWRALVVHSELYAALAVAALYVIAIVVFFPAFFEHAAIGPDVYMPVRRPLTTVLRDPTLADWLALIVLLAIIARRRLAEPLIAAPALASLGAMGAYVMQDKLWPYQGYPALALAALALGPPIIESLTGARRADDWPRRPMIAAIGVGLLACAGVWLAQSSNKPELERVVAAIAPHPKLLAIGGDISIGHPLTRNIGGVWVGSLCSLWITDMTSLALERNPSPEEARKYQDYLRFDRQTLVADIVNRKPDAILIAGDGWLAWARGHADVAAALAGYRLRAAADDIMVYARANPGATAGDAQ